MPTTKPSARLRAVAPFVIAVAVTLLFAASGITDALDRAWFDLLQRALARSGPAPDDTAIVLVDEQSLQALGADPYAMRWPWPRRAFAGLFTALHRAGARHVVADFLFLENSSDAADDALLGSAAAGLRDITLGALRRPAPGAPPALPVVWPEAFRREHASFFDGGTARSRWGWVDVSPDADGIQRRYTPAGSLGAAALAENKHMPGGEHLLRWAGGLEQLKARGVPVLPAAPFAAAGMAILNEACARTGEFENPAALGAAIGTEPAPVGGIFERVRGRVVFVGANAAGAFDAIATPADAPEPGVIAHWTAFANLRAGTLTRDAGRAPVLAAALAAMLAVAHASPRRRRGRADGGHSPQAGGLRAPAAVAVAVTLLALPGGAALLHFGNIWLAPSLVVIGSVAAFGAGVADGYLRERALKREIQTWFGAYVSPAVVEKLIRDPGSLALGGERRELTVFFSDIAGFTSLSERLDSAQLVALVNGYLHEFSEGVLAHGCYIDKYIGDALMGVFGAPGPLENHALAACRAALECRRRLDAINERLERDHGMRLGVRIGINTGPMVVGNVGTEKKKNYTVLGDAVNLAARLESANKQFGTGILIGPLTAARVAGLLATRPVGLLRVKGKAEAVAVHELVGEPDSLTAAQRGHLGACAEGFAAWCERRFADAAAAYARAVALRADDTVSARYHEAALTLAASPPPEDWDPVIELHSK
ncbi:adenylate/guanylate cyclase domain-containing protein [Termitidicoccus mucosus]|uniref:Guanylate cyclase domain-containing protein n=1 Tax=Termitidicoccus mucosus TaxID=1184151 RepID=A0A178IIA8_9BACT|nr:hypothetical protein AW736_14060 [Opitutaceae bacterium TSB47]